MNHKALNSSVNTEWGTPQWLFDTLDNEFHFTLDPASTEQNTKCKMYYTEWSDGLKWDWSDHRVFVNPPYSRYGNPVWARKIFDEGQKTLVVALVAARTDTKYFHEYYTKAAQLRFLEGRVKFINANPESDTTISRSVATFPSVIVIFDPSNEYYFNEKVLFTRYYAPRKSNSNQD